MSLTPWKYLTVALIVILALSFNNLPKASGAAPFIKQDTMPNSIIGNFRDDYDIEYSISDSVWIQQPNVKYHILKINTEGEYIIARNDKSNPSEAGLYTRIDYLKFKGMPPFEWGFCLTTFNAINDSIAECNAKADRMNPKKGCNGFPFSRMKRIEPLTNYQ